MMLTVLLASGGKKVKAVKAGKLTERPSWAKWLDGLGPKPTSGKRAASVTFESSDHVKRPRQKEVADALHLDSPLSRLKCSLYHS